MTLKDLLERYSPETKCPYPLIENLDVTNSDEYLFANHPNLYMIALKFYLNSDECVWDMHTCYVEYLNSNDRNNFCISLVHDKKTGELYFSLMKI